MTTPLPTWTENLIGFDLETTGVDPDTARLVSAAVVDYENGQRVDGVEWRIDPGVEIPQEASKVHGVWEADRTGRQDHDTAVNEIVDELYDAWDAGYTIVVFNAPFDLTLLANRARDAGRDFQIRGRVMDPLVVDRYLDKYRKGRRTLSAQAEHYGVDLENAHTAEADAEAAVEIALAVAARWPQELADDTLMDRQRSWANENMEGLRAWLRKQGKSTADLRPGWPVRE